MSANKISFFSCDNGDASLIEAHGKVIMTDINYRADAADKNLARYYRMSAYSEVCGPVLPNLFGEWKLQREWGRVGQSYHFRLVLFSNEVEADRALNALEGAKQRSAYEQAMVRH